MEDVKPLINALHPSVVDRLDPQFAEIYTKYQGAKTFQYFLT
jgi:hypothetical protein